MNYDLYPIGLLEGLRCGKVVPFIGAGLSIPQGGVSWHQLIVKLIQEANIKLGFEPKLSRHISEIHDDSIDLNSLFLSSYDPLMIVEIFQKKEGRTRLIEIILEMCQNITGPSESHNMLAAMDFGFFVTTNYDNLIEKALKGQEYQVIVNEQDVAYLENRNVKILKMHGSIIDPFMPKSIIASKK